MRVVMLILAVSLLALTARADPADPPELQAGLEEFRARLALTPEQESQVRSIFEAHLDALLATLDKYDIDIGSRGGTASVDPQTMRALREELRASGAKIEGRLTGVFSATQMAEFGRIRAEQGEAPRADPVAAGGRGAPILKEHFEAQMAIPDEHGIVPGRRDSAERPGFRTMRKLRRDMRRNDAKTGERLSDILSEAQLAVYEALQAEQRKNLRALLSRRLANRTRPCLECPLPISARGGP